MGVSLQLFVIVCAASVVGVVLSLAVLSMLQIRHRHERSLDQSRRELVVATCCDADSSARRLSAELGALRESWKSSASTDSSLARLGAIEAELEQLRMSIGDAVELGTLHSRLLPDQLDRSWIDIDLSGAPTEFDRLFDGSTPSNPTFFRRRIDPNL